MFTNPSTITFTIDLYSTVYTTIVNNINTNEYNSFNYIINGDTFIVDKIGVENSKITFTAPDLNTYTSVNDDNQLYSQNISIYSYETNNNTNDIILNKAKQLYSGTDVFTIFFSYP
jgi:hypothetical protein